MEGVHKSLLAVLLGALLMAVLIGATAVGLGARPAAAAVTKKLTISTAEFSPVYDSSYVPTPHEKWGDYLRSRADGTTIELVAPVQFPYDGMVTVEKVELMANDANINARALLALYRSNPSNVWSRREMARIDTGTAWAEGYHVWSEPNVSPRYVNPGHQAWLWLVLDDDTDLYVYGVRIYYHKGK
jgi:hypothetical protein